VLDFGEQNEKCNSSGQDAKYHNMNAMKIRELARAGSNM
jgi:hypothetical protein